MRQDLYLTNYLKSPDFIATRDGFGTGLVEAAKHNKKIIAICADLTESLRMKDFQQTYPERFVQVGVAEQNLVGVAAGMALAGKIPFAASYAVFNPGRTWEQIRQTVCYSNLNVKIVGGHAGLITGPDGATHQALEDIALTRVLPNISVVVPCDAEETRKATLAIAEHPGPCYLRLGRAKVRNLTTNKTPFQLGKALTMRDGTDLTIIACGAMVAEALLAAENLAKNDIWARVINLHTIKPLDKQTITQAAQETGAILTVEEHQIAGGMGSAVAETISQEIGRSLAHSVPMKIMGIKNSFGESGSAEELLKKYQLTDQDIVKAAYRLLDRKAKSH